MNFLLECRFQHLIHQSIINDDNEQFDPWIGPDMPCIYPRQD